VLFGGEFQISKSCAYVYGTVHVISGKNNTRWFPVAFLVVFLLMVAALPSLEPHHIISYIQPHDIDALTANLLLAGVVWI